MQSKRPVAFCGLIAVLVLVLATCAIVLAPAAFAAREAKGERPAGEEGAAKASEGDFAAGRLLDKAQELIDGGEQDRGVKILETILEQYPSSPVRYKAYLALGKHYLSIHDQAKAIAYLRNLKQLETPDEPLSAEMKEVYLEGLYLTGVSYFKTRQYAAAFPMLRKITTDYPNTVWANQSYYFIGMCHFAQGNWNKAIEALGLVGTFVDPESPTVQYVEAGRRFFVKIDDGDLPVLSRLGKEVSVIVQAASGDNETVVCAPLAGNDNVFIGSIPTELGLAKAGDKVLQVVGGDKIDTKYVDDNTKDGTKDVPRQSGVKVVSTASVAFTLGDFESRSAAAFLGQPAFALLTDADKDAGAEADSITVKIVSRYKEEEEATASKEAGVDVEKLFREGEQTYQIRDEVVLKLTEIGQPPVRSGRFGGKLELQNFREDQPIDKADQVLTCAIDDEIVATYVDELHIAGDSPRQVTAIVRVISEIDGRPQATQYVVSDPVIAARKNIVEASAYLELGKIFKSMGLVKGASEKCDEGLERVEQIVRSRTPMPASINEEAFKIKWELYLVKDDYGAAIQTCQLFNRLYPDSPFVDQALMQIGNIKYENKDYHEAVGIYRQILALTKSQAKAEAQYHIAEATESLTKPGSEAAINEFKLCAERYPDSEFAGASLAKLVDYHIETKDYGQANELLDQIFQDYPDAQFLDGMLLKWVIVSYRMNDFEKAYEKCSQLLFEYPESRFAERAKAILPKIEERVKK